MTMDYKQQKELFVSGGQGCSPSDLAAVWFTCLLTHILWRFAHNRTRGAHTRSGRVTMFGLAIEFAALVVPMVLVTTALAGNLWTTNFVLGLISVLLSLTTQSDSKSQSPSNSPSSSSQKASTTTAAAPAGATLDQRQPEAFNTKDEYKKPAQSSSSPIDLPYEQDDELSPTTSPQITRRRNANSHELLVDESSDSSKHTPSFNPTRSHFFQQPFITVYRAQLMLITSICILAVDFQLFPRKFAKTESWGISLMDLGVGSFVFSLGVVSALPILKRSPIGRSLWRDAWNATRKTTPLVLLGLVRILFIKGVDYPEHVTEYGVHWNFFFTLSILPIIGVLARRAYEALRADFVLIGVVFAAVHQAILSLGGAAEYVLSDAPRISLVSANREGLTSVLGYATIYLFGLATGCYVLPPSPDYLQKLRAGTSVRKISISKPGKALVVYTSWCIVWWTAYALACAFLAPPSRRLANPTYCLWVTAVNLSLITGHCVVNRVELVLGDSQTVPLIFEAINRNSLVVFLVANLITGAINVTIQTMFMSDWMSLMILSIYCKAVVGIGLAVRKYKCKI